MSSRRAWLTTSRAVQLETARTRQWRFIAAQKGLTVSRIGFEWTATTAALQAPRNPPIARKEFATMGEK